MEQSEWKLIGARNARESTRMEGFETPFSKMRAASASQKLSPQIVALCLFDSADHACAFAPWTFCCASPRSSDQMNDSVRTLMRYV